MAKAKYQWVVETLVGTAGVFSTRKGAQDLVRRIKESGSVPKDLKIVKHKLNPHVYDSAGKHIGKFKRKAAKIVARVTGGSVGKPKKNPIPRGKALAFQTKAAAKKWVREHRVKGYRASIRKAAR
jgi:hypothetical protein